jgi:hypothetical protein
MTNRPQLSALRRLGFGLLTMLALITPALAGQVLTDPATAAGASGSAAAYDAHVRQSDCDLLGREYVRHRGCSRTKCVDGAVPWRTTYGAEACTLKDAERGYGFAATVDVRQCRALHRRWIAQVNYCASEPDRSPGALYNAPQCVGATSVYVPAQERPGYYDECITLAQAVELERQASEDQSTLQAEVEARSAVQCGYRPRHALVGGVCVATPGAEPSGGGVAMIGDSLTWRGSDELARLRPTFALDGEPARPPTELAQRLAFFRSLHGDPDGLIIELGTVPAKGFSRRDLAKVVRSLPRSTKVMFVLPHYELRTHPLVVTPQSRKFNGWMRSLAGSRARSCVADWPAYVRAHAGILQDGVHVKHRAEGRWAHWISQQWSRC